MQRELLVEGSWVDREVRGVGSEQGGLCGLVLSLIECG